LARAIVDEILVALAMEFDDFEAQRDWFIGLVNDAMPMPTNGSGHPTALDDDGFTAIMRALYANLATALESDDGDALVAAKFSRPAVIRILVFLEALDEH
jgi:hypothetical protein